MYDVGQNEFHSHDSIMMVMMMMMMMVVVMMMMMMMMMMMRWDSIWSDAVLKQKVRCRGCLGFSKATWNLPNDLLLLRPLDLLLSSNHGENGGTLGVDHWRGSHSKETHPFSPLVCSKPKRKNPWGSMDFFMPPDLSNGPTVGKQVRLWCDVPGMRICSWIHFLEFGEHSDSLLGSVFHMTFLMGEARNDWNELIQFWVGKLVAKCVVFFFLIVVALLMIGQNKEM